MTRPPDWRSPFESRQRMVEREVVTWRVMMAARRAIRRVQDGAIVADSDLDRSMAACRTRHERRSVTIEREALATIVATDEREIMLELMRFWGLR